MMINYHYSIQNQLFKKVLPSYFSCVIVFEFFVLKAECQVLFRDKQSRLVNHYCSSSAVAIRAVLQPTMVNFTACWKRYLINYQSFTFSPTGPFTITIPKIGVAVGSAALAFQITVLDPWCDFSNAPLIRLNVLKSISFSYRHHDLTKQVNELQVSTFYAPNGYIIFSWSFSDY